MTEIANYGYKGEKNTAYPKDVYHPVYPEAKSPAKKEPAAPKAEVPGYDCTANPA